MANWSQGAQGAVGGALAGGSMFGPLGAIGGGLLGGLGGLFGDGQNDEHRRRLEAAYAGIGGPAPQAGPAAQGAYSGFRANQADLINRLEAMSRGEGPSLAAQQYQQATDRGNSQQQAMAASGRGGPLASFNAAANMANMGAQNAQGLAQARTAEQMGAMNQLGLTIHGARGADEGMNRFNAEQTNQNSWRNLDARLQSMGIDAQQRMSILQQMGQNAQQPGLGSQLLAGGAGMFAAGAMNRRQGPGQPQPQGAFPSQGYGSSWGEGFLNGAGGGNGAPGWR